ncbi:HxlR family transcriptional regulator [Afipia sp. P52-10]|jgi:DNA-binding HxlR family transcriptional regulator|uniref:winged helix-turn-helix transcriptional regulator n=1 Tax=Afipia sp. P52-10 TaxID=1429916 RepID=UPI0003DF1B7F|nr:helix-turn-helix domain-containing protein [Afipia sp. P52-10]ETR78556.1 HxlR family transcriptional regulator [Afipia sp. P52-10]
MANTIPSVFDESCSARHALELISGKWPILIISALADGPMRNGMLLRRIGGISQKMLTQTLKELECNGLLQRDDRGTVPPNVEYRLTPLGHSLTEALKVLDRWAEDNFPALDAARESFLKAQSSKL